jgi:hypothetical protein
MVRVETFRTCTETVSSKFLHIDTDPNVRLLQHPNHRELPSAHFSFVFSGCDFSASRSLLVLLGEVHGGRVLTRTEFDEPTHKPLANGAISSLNLSVTYINLILSSHQIVLPCLCIHSMFPSSTLHFMLFVITITIILVCITCYIFVRWGNEWNFVHLHSINACKLCEVRTVQGSNAMKTAASMSLKQHLTLWHHLG